LHLAHITHYTTFYQSSIHPLTTLNSPLTTTQLAFPSIILLPIFTLPPSSSSSSFQHHQPSIIHIHQSTNYTHQTFLLHQLHTHTHTPTTSCHLSITIISFLPSSHQSVHQRQNYSIEHQKTPFSTYSSLLHLAIDHVLSAEPTRALQKYLYPPEYVLPERNTLYLRRHPQFILTRPLDHPSPPNPRSLSPCLTSNLGTQQSQSLPLDLGFPPSTAPVSTIRPHAIHSRPPTRCNYLAPPSSSPCYLTPNAHFPPPNSLHSPLTPGLQSSL
jgi:hypothetical protein